MGVADRSPYQPPAAPVADVAQDASHGLRAKWLYLGLAFPMTTLYVYIVASSRFTPAILGAIAALSSLLLYFPLRRLLARSSAPGPRWFSGLLFAVLGVNLYGALTNRAELFLPTGIPFAAMFLGIALGITYVERRHGVRVYAKKRQFLFIPSGKA